MMKGYLIWNLNNFVCKRVSFEYRIKPQSRTQWWSFYDFKTQLCAVFVSSHPKKSNNFPQYLLFRSEALRTLKRERRNGKNNKGEGARHRKFGFESKFQVANVELSSRDAKMRSKSVLCKSIGKVSPLLWPRFTLKISHMSENSISYSIWTTMMISRFIC